MKHISSKMKAFYAIALVTLSVTVSSFTEKSGGEGFEVYLNNRLLVQQFGTKMSTVHSIQLDQRFSGDQLVVKYYHCGQAGKNRVITIRDAQDKVLKQWKYPNNAASSMASSEAGMSCPVKDILGLQKTNPGKLSLHYSSDQLPKGRLLAVLIGAEVVKAK